MIIKIHKEEFESYLEDTSNLKGSASSLYIAETAEEIPEIIKILRLKKIPFTICAGRTGTTGGCVPLSGAIISTENLNRIINIDKENKTADIESAVTFEKLEAVAAKLNLNLAAQPTESLAYVGGAISTCASGVRGFGYGSIRNYIEAINVVLPTGEVLEIKRGAIFSKQRVFDCVCSKKKLKFKLPSYVAPKIKSQAGYFVNDNMDLIDLFIGSEGTLGVITSCKLRLQDKPQGIFDGLIFFKEEAQGLAFITEVKELKDKKALFTASLEFFDKNSIEMLRKEYPFMPRAACAVYFEQITHLKEKAPDLLKIWLSLIDNYKTFSDYNLLADTASERKKVFEIRHRVPQLINEFLREHKQIKASLDCAVPSDSMVEMYNFYKEKAEESKISYVNFGHIGEAHLHFNFLPKNEDESIRAKKYIEIFCKKAVSLGGTISAEHGIGKLKKPYLKIMYGADKIEEMAALKKYFDPDCLLGLDNLFDKEVLSKI